jgi:hypothetical protein
VHTLNVNHPTLMFAIFACAATLAPRADAFGVDVCFNSPTSGQAPIRNCINVEQVCRTSNLAPSQQVGCRVVATADSLSGLSGSNAIVGARSLLHSDSTYLMAQLIGYTPWQAYQVMIYNEATDQSEYTPFDQNGAQVLADDEIANCRSQWGPAMPRRCRILTPEMNGIYKFNDETGGMLLHLHARFSPNGAAPPAIGFPADYFSAANARYEPLLNNLRAWAFDQRPDACVGGIVARVPMAVSATAPCEVRDRVLNSPQSFFAAGVTRLKVPFSSNLGTLIISQSDRGTVVATDRSLQAFIAPQEVSFAKLGIFLHALGDRASHHVCTDRSWFYRQASGNYTSNYDSLACGQGSHFLWHAWEQGTEQSAANLNPEHQTMRPTLEAVFDQLVAAAPLRRVPVSSSLNRQEIVDRLIAVLGIYDPSQRLDAMVTLMEQYHVLPLPGHGTASTLTIEQWLNAARGPR